MKVISETQGKGYKYLYTSEMEFVKSSGKYSERFKITKQKDGDEYILYDTKSHRLSYQYWRGLIEGL